MGKLRDELPKKEPNHPGWKPGVEIDGDSGTIISKATTVPPEEYDERSLIAEWSLNPDEWLIEGKVGLRCWDQAIGNGQVRRMYHYKLDVRRRNGPSVNIEDLKRHIRAREPLERRFDKHGSGWLVACVGDTQFGKPDGDGTKGTVARWKRAVGAVIERGEREGTPDLLIPATGDNLENCAGFYPYQLNTIDLSLTEQLDLAIELFSTGVVDLASAFRKVKIIAVPGNHGEVRTVGGKRMTDPNDNYDTFIWQQVKRVVRWHRLAKRIEIRVPEAGRMSQRVDVDGFPITVTHGHLFKGGSPDEAAWKWWKDQTGSGNNLGHGQTRMLINGHFHHTIINGRSGCWHIQHPALDGGSEYWRELHGDVAKSGLLTFVIREGDWDLPSIL